MTCALFFSCDNLHEAAQELDLFFFSCSGSSAWVKLCLGVVISSVQRKKKKQGRDKWRSLYASVGRSLACYSKLHTHPHRCPTPLGELISSWQALPYDHLSLCGCQICNDSLDKHGKKLKCAWKEQHFNRPARLQACNYLFFVVTSQNKSSAVV